MVTGGPLDAKNAKKKNINTLFFIGVLVDFFLTILVFEMFTCMHQWRSQFNLRA